MKFTATIKDIKQAYGVIKPAIPRRGGLPTLLGVHIHAEDGQVTFTATNLDFTAQHTFPAEVQDPGTILLHHKLVAEATKGRGDVDFIEETPEPVGTDTPPTSGHVVIAGPGGRSRSELLNLREFPKLTVLDSTEEAQWERTLPADQISRVTAAASGEDSRPILTGVLFTGDELVATDSYRLHASSVEGDRLPEPVLIPGSALGAITKAAAGGHVKLTGGKHEIVFEHGRSRWASRLIEGEFPNYKQLFPSSQPNHVDFDRVELAAALERAKRFVTDSTPVRLSFTEQQATLTVINHFDSETQNETTIGVRWATGEPADGFVVAFNPAYLLSAVKTIDADRVSLGWTDSLKPGLVTPTEVNPTETRLLMPVRIP